MARQHGTRSCYAGGCRLPECREAARAYWRQYNRIIRDVSGNDRFVDPSRAVKHIRSLREQGIGRDVIARAAGMTKHQIFQIDHENQKHIRLSTERKILAVRADPVLVPATGTIRRLQGLAALGYTLHQLADAVDSCAVYLSRVTQGKTGHVYRTTADNVAAAYDRMGMTPGPSERSKARALAKGWVPPLAWDDDTIDDPDARPEGVRVGKGRGEYEFDIDEWFRLVRMGELPDIAAKRCGVQLVAVERRARRMGRAPEYVTAMERARERHTA